MAELIALDSQAARSPHFRVFVANLRGSPPSRWLASLRAGGLAFFMRKQAGVVEVTAGITALPLFLSIILSSFEEG